jgi:hypothetical protein
MGDWWFHCVMNLKSVSIPASKNQRFSLLSHRTCGFTDAVDNQDLEISIEGSINNQTFSWKTWHP